MQHQHRRVSRAIRAELGAALEELEVLRSDEEADSRLERCGVLESAAAHPLCNLW